ncbi:hypothetical protein SD37_31845 [Amycolatopsis orientalis]|uniref:Uncharacterized protein n=1 Tax=Amycolatopsis orientalis TaxID=31958 RepID=A0A193C5X1_AMYOR|nr:kelch repeat-containing protein [Amycolatopsis orientalis]ANN19763.1 hypothetical protein SD37_31845 [Amycolatopsis orientalis]
MGDGDFPARAERSARDDQEGPTKSVLILDEAREKWTEVAPMRYLYAIGGQSPVGESLATVERYDVEADEWQILSPLKQSRLLPGATGTKIGKRRFLAVVEGGEIAVGEVRATPRRTAELFDIDAGEWGLLDVLLPLPRGSNECATEEDGTVLTIGVALPEGDQLRLFSDVDALRQSTRSVG